MKYKRVYLNRKANRLTITRHNDSGDLCTIYAYKLTDKNARRFFNAVRGFVPMAATSSVTVYDSRHLWYTRRR
jgi:hypothetical protein